MRTAMLLLVTAACSSSPRPTAAPPPPPPPPAALAPDASPPLPPSTLGSTSHARQIVKSPWGMRRTFALTRTVNRVELVIETYEWADPDERIHLDGSEHDETMWRGPVREEYSGTARDDGASTELALTLVRRTPHARVRLEMPVQLAWTCQERPLVVHALDARPIRIRPPSTEKTGCSGSPVRWKPASVETIPVWACGMQMFGRQADFPFTDDRDIEWVAEWVDCHIQEVAYRKARPLSATP